MFHYDIKDLDCIICLGQSNEEGGDSATNPSSLYLNSQPYTNIFYKPDLTSTLNGSIQKYQYSINNNSRSNKYPGPDVSVGIQYNTLTGKPLLIIKHAYGGSALVDDGSYVWSTGLWQIDANATRANNLLHYDIALNNFIIPCLNQAVQRGIRLNILATCWCQGESDSGTVYGSSNYQAELIRLFDALETALTPYGVLSPNYKPLITRLHNNYTVGTRPYMSVIRTAQENVAAYYSAQWIDTDAYPVAADNTHWTATGQTTHGIDRATKLATYYQ